MRIGSGFGDRIPGAGGRGPDPAGGRGAERCAAQIGFFRRTA
jgi:hypothetical protein